MTFSLSILNTNQDKDANDHEIKELLKETLKQFKDYKRVHWIPKARKVNTRRLTFTFDETMEGINEKYLPLDRKVGAFFNGQSLSYFKSESLKELNLFNFVPATQLSEVLKAENTLKSVEQITINAKNMNNNLFYILSNAKCIKHIDRLRIPRKRQRW